MWYVYYDIHMSVHPSILPCMICVYTIYAYWVCLCICVLCIDSNGIQPHNHLVCKRTLNHLAKPAKN